VSERAVFVRSLMQSVRTAWCNFDLEPLLCFCDSLEVVKRDWSRAERDASVNSVAISTRKPHSAVLTFFRWWKETGTEERENGEVCVWTVIRGVSADGAVEWENKWWEVRQTVHPTLPRSLDC
jgi:hypothetical protein